MSETASGAGQKSQESGIQSVPGTQGTTQAHTPAPWEYEEDDAIVYAGGGSLPIASVYEADDFPCLGDDPARQAETQQECAANARLIAAAPGLLALAEKVAEHFFGTDSPLGAEAYALLSKVSR